LTDGNLVQLGHGSKQRRIWTAETDRTSAIAEYISSDKDLTKSLLSSCGVPVPAGRIVESAEEAWEEAQDLGLPVVIKPVDGNHGRGVSIELTTKAHIEVAFELAMRHGSEVIVERFIPGNEHRLLVVGGKVVAAARGESAWVTGDGIANIQELVDQQINSDSRRGHGEDFPLNRIDIKEDEAVQLELARQGYAPNSIPEHGKAILIQRNGNVAIDCTDEVHPDNAELVVLAAQVVGLDIAGVDMVVEDVSKPLNKQGGALVEVNAGPGLLTHLKPAVGNPRPVGAAIVSHLFPKGDRGRIPVVGIAGTTHTTEIARLVAWLLRLSGEQVGLACKEGLFLDRRQVSPRNSVNFDAGQRLLMNRTVSAVVIESDAEAILKEGLSYDRSAVSIITDTHWADSLSEFHVSDENQVFDVLRTLVDVVLPDGFAVLNAAEPLVVEMAPLCDGSVIFYHAFETLPAMIEHRTQNGRIVFIRDGQTILARGKEEWVLNTRQSLSINNKGPLEVNSILAAVAATWAMGLPIELIRAGIETFEAEHALNQMNHSSQKTKKKRTPSY
jgi:cyanophycin synthetase